MTPPKCTLDDRVMSNLLSLARGDPAGYVTRGEWVAIADFSSRWQTAFVHIECPPDLVCTIAECGVYARVLYAELAGAYAAGKVPMPVWRSWGNLVKAWPFLQHHVVLSPMIIPKPVFSKVNIVRPL